MLLLLAGCGGGERGVDGGTPSSGEPPVAESRDEPSPGSSNASRGDTAPGLSEEATAPDGDRDASQQPLPDVPLPTLQPPEPSVPQGTSCPPGFAYLPGAGSLVLGEPDEDRARACACDPNILRAATFDSIPPACMDTHPFPGSGQPWPSDSLFASTRFALIEDLRHLLPRWGRRLCTYSEVLLEAAGPGNQRFIGSSAFEEGRCEDDHHSPDTPIGSHPRCVTENGVMDLNVRSEWLLVDEQAAPILAKQLEPRVRAGMLALSTANTGEGGNSAAANNYGLHAHVYPWGFFDVGDPPGDGYIDDGVRFCATPGTPPDEAKEAELRALRDRYVTTGDWSALWGADERLRTSDFKDWTAVAAGRNHSCGLRSGRPVCWGSNHWGESAMPDEPLTSITVGWRHSCGLRPDGSVSCWGDDAMGQTTAPPGTFSAVGAGDFFTCGLREDGKVACWGKTWRDSWQKPPDLRFQHLAVSDGNACGISDGAVHCWGETRWPRGQPPAEFSFDALDLGFEEICGIENETGTVSCWGNLDRIKASIPVRTKQRGVSSGTRMRCTLDEEGRAICSDDLERSGRLPPAETRFRSLSVGYAHACGVTDRGNLRCFGGNSFHQSHPP